jgi:hypothetical protein
VEEDELNNDRLLLVLGKRGQRMIGDQLLLASIYE